MPWKGPQQEGDFPSLGYVVADWIESHCVQPDRENAGQPFRLTDDQYQHLIRFYRLRPDAEKGDRSPFVYSESMYVRPQKFGKSPFSASVILAESIGPVLFDGWNAEGEPVGRPWSSPLIQTAANSEGQTGNVFDALTAMVNLGPLADELDAGLTRVLVPGGGRIEPVTSQAVSRLGQRITFAVLDEIGLWTPNSGGQALADTLARGVSGMNGRYLATSNTWDPAQNSVAQQLAESEEPSVLIDHLTADPKLDYSVTEDRHEIHRQLYSLAPWVNIESINKRADILAKRDLPQAARFYGNIISQAKGSWIDAEAWKSAERPMPDELAEILATLKAA